MSPREFPAPPQTPFSSEAPELAAALEVAARFPLFEGERESLDARLGNVADHNLLVERARVHRVAPLLHHHLGPDGSALLGPPAHDRLVRLVANGARAGIAVAHELRLASEALERAGVTFIPYKGPLLALRLFGEIGLRPSGDVDLIVRPAELERARLALERCGYRTTGGSRWPSEVRAPIREIHTSLRRAPRAPAVEIHWALQERCFSSDVLHQCLLGEWFEAESRDPSPEVTLILLATHGLRHAWGLYYLLADVGALLRQGRVDSTRLRALAAATRTERPVALAIDLASRTLGAPAPEGFTPSCVGRRHRLGVSLVRRLQRSTGSDSRPPHRWARLALSLLATSTLVAAVRLVWRFAVMPSAADRDLIDLPAPWSVIYVVLRPVRLVTRYVLGPSPRTTAKAADLP